ncbi:MAG: alkaline phosphatase family protein [candidate division KSB1 bacterium]|nr:alkaline phosphatase family protein [candidate division KSB1 bacterium]
MRKRVLLLFVDGIGIGADDPEVNPFARFAEAFLPLTQSRWQEGAPHEGTVVPTRVDMGVPGLPQSATGQTALFCGVNSAQAVGRHIAGFPTPTLRKLIDANSIFLQLKQRGKTGTFANALTEEYFQMRGERISATTRSLLAGGFPPRMLDALRQQRAVSHDLTNEFLTGMGYQVPRFSVPQSAEILAGMLEEVDFCLFEFILSDRAGHQQDFGAAKQVIHKLSTLLQQLLPILDLDTTTVLLSSDHGNMEDLSVKTHTHNPVPTMIWGAGRHAFAERIRTIEEITPAILHWLDS